MTTSPAARDDASDNTRHRILAHVLRHGPVSAVDISDAFQLSAAGVRRHLDNLVAEGLAEVVSAPKSGQRGRPAKLFRLTDEGRSHFGHDYDSLAVLALRTVRTLGGEKAVEEFGRQRMSSLLHDLDRDAATARAAGVASASDPEVGEERTGAEDDAALIDKAHAIADALTKRGYAATVDHTAGGVQICRHHCPIQDVAQEFPELCAAEHRVVAELLGHHIQPLATIADGNGICTTHIPLTTIHPSPEESPSEHEGK